MAGLVERLLGRVCSACGHPREAHQHYRRGTDCSVRDCGCPRFRR
ncbi:hypothetical protein [Kineococcus rubinsiae]|nr:hypothetical protein [Kineococcus rubinsiae]